MKNHMFLKIPVESLALAGHITFKICQLTKIFNQGVRPMVGSGVVGLLYGRHYVRFVSTKDVIGFSVNQNIIVCTIISNNRPKVL